MAMNEICCMWESVNWIVCYGNVICGKVLIGLCVMAMLYVGKC